MKTLENIIKKNCTVICNLLYYLGKGGGDKPSMTLMIPETYKTSTLEQYHKKSAHSVIDKCFNVIRRNITGLDCTFLSSLLWNMLPAALRARLED